jgi:lysophospholipase L1-like esterase
MDQQGSGGVLFDLETDMAVGSFSTPTGSTANLTEGPSEFAIFTPSEGAGAIGSWPTGPITYGTCLNGAVRTRLGDTNCDGVVRVAIIGDSYISGEGAATDAVGYSPETNGKTNHCHRSANSWAYQTAASLAAPGDILFAACSGAVTEHLVSIAQWPDSPSGVHGGEPQLETLRNFGDDRSADIVFLSIGGNDADFGGLATSCIMNWCDPQALIRSMPWLQAKIRNTYLNVKAAAPTAETFRATRHRSPRRRPSRAPA